MQRNGYLNLPRVELKEALVHRCYLAWWWWCPCPLCRQHRDGYLCFRSSMFCVCSIVIDWNGCVLGWCRDDPHRRSKLQAKETVVGLISQCTGWQSPTEQNTQSSVSVLVMDAVWIRSVRCLEQRRGRRWVSCRSSWDAMMKNAWGVGVVSNHICAVLWPTFALVIVVLVSCFLFAFLVSAVRQRRVGSFRSLVSCNMWRFLCKNRTSSFL